MQRKWATILLSSLIFLNGCQIMPHAKGLQSPLWQAQTYQRQDQVEVQWKQQSFSFLLYQQQKGAVLDMVALSLTGQQLFKLQFDGHRVHVEQRIDQMRLLPLSLWYVIFVCDIPSVFAFRATSCRDETTSR